MQIKPTSSPYPEELHHIFIQTYEELHHAPAPDFETVTEGEKIFAAYIENQIVGFVTFWEPDQFIHILFVDPKFRSRHVGTQLIQTLSSHYGYPLSLKCLSSNTNALQFYLHTGWKSKETGTSDDGEYYLMQLDMPSD